MFDVEKINNSTLAHIGKVIGLQKSQVANLRAKKRELSALEMILINEDQDNLILRFFNWQPDEILFWNNLEKFQSIVSKNDAQMAELFSLDQRSYRFYRAKAKSLSWRACEYFHQRYKIHPVLWFTRDIDIDCLAKNISSPFRSNAYLPAIFEGGGSRMRTFSNTIMYAKKTWGNEVASALLSSMQITQDSLSFSEKSISIRVFATLHQKLRSFGAKDQHFIEMGSNNLANESNRKMFSQHFTNKNKTHLEVLKFFMLNLVARLDTNKLYRQIESSKDYLKIKATTSESFISSFKDGKPFSQYEIALFTQGHIAVIPAYFDLRPLKNIQLEFDHSSGEAIYTIFTN